ncbi:hypothetical protein [Nocardioides jishulii]|uniref:Uncharacterized protein n=1 Tax=Nocardioides jishulii TaxID=2575440 RepID=A0A4U2YMP5_9ACTN|nr:hypothetical protein [Nocardioides jishulii]QCX27740.1 hypothetical protein FCL41_09535 [Nocardioides jishulii]TKI62546.1 hypothetical protein FC770_09200 [Nocardioides jishulii]
MHTVSPLAFSNLPHPQPNPFRSAGQSGASLSPAAELTHAIDLAVAESTASLPTLESLASSHPSPMVEHWRRTARAAALAEHDTSRRVTAQMTVPQAQAIVADIAAMTQALVILDQRYRNTPGWEPLTQSARLGWVSLAAALDINLGQPDYSVDHLGWRPKTKVIPHPVRPGILGVLQAQHNLVIRMSAFPTATNLRLVVDSQRLVSAHLVPFAARVDDRLAARWSQRAETYTLIQKQLRDIGGVLGNGASAAAEGANAVARLRAIAPTTIVEARVLSGFQLLFNRLDHRIADVINEGLQRGAYCERVALPHFENGTGHMVTPVNERFAPTSPATDLAVVHTVNQRLRPQAPPTAPAATPGPTRVELHAALTHRPPPPNDCGSLGR